MLSPFNRGRHAFKYGVKRSANPYDYYDDYVNYAAWARGYDWVKGGGE